jgi:hypothetical protein
VIWPPRAEDLLSLPEDFPPPLDLPAEAKSKLKLRLLGQVFDLEQPAPAPAEPMNGQLETCPG